MSTTRDKPLKRKNKFIKRLTKSEIETNNISDIRAQYNDVINMYMSDIKI